jgi:hypothetical protein
VSALIFILVGSTYLQHIAFTADGLSSSLTGTSKNKSEAGVLSNEQNNSDSEDGLFSLLTETATKSPTKPPTHIPTTAPTLKPTTGIESKSVASESESESESAGIHSEQVSFLDLLPWEEDSLDIEVLPSSTGRGYICCLGSFSKGGGVNTKQLIFDGWFVTSFPWSFLYL